jgi:hypothetical protein
VAIRVAVGGCDFQQRLGCGRVIAFYGARSALISKDARIPARCAGVPKGTRRKGKTVNPSQFPQTLSLACLVRDRKCLDGAVPTGLHAAGDHRVCSSAGGLGYSPPWRRAATELTYKRSVGPLPGSP